LPLSEGCRLPFEDDAFATIDRDDDILLSNNSIIFVCALPNCGGCAHTFELQP
jgi:hypothetical protein